MFPSSPGLTYPFPDTLLQGSQIEGFSQTWYVYWGLLLGLEHCLNKVHDNGNVLGVVYVVCDVSGNCPSICCVLILGLGFMEGITIYRVFSPYDFI